MYLVRCASWEVCEGLLGLEIPCDSYCDSCVVNPPGYNQLTEYEYISDQARKRCEAVLSSHPSIGQTTIRDPSGTEHPYDPDRRYEWDHHMPIADLHFLNFRLQSGLDHLIHEKIVRGNQVLSIEELSWYLHIRCAYQRALSRFLIRTRANGFVHHYLDWRRDDDTDILLDRLRGISTMIPNTSPDLQDVDCPYCLEPLYHSTEQAIRLPCGRHIIGLNCLTRWIDCWDLESPLRICTLCNTDFDITKPVQLAEYERLPGFEPAENGYVPDSVVVRVFLDNLIEKRLASGSDTDTPSPWWVSVLRQCESSSSSS
jgi:hypothetical protein